MQRHLGDKGQMLCPGCIGASASWDLQDTPDRGGDAAALLLLLLLPFLSTKEKKKKKIPLNILMEKKHTSGQIGN